MSVPPRAKVRAAKVHLRSPEKAKEATFMNILYEGFCMYHRSGLASALNLAHPRRKLPSPHEVTGQKNIKNHSSWCLPAIVEKA